MPYKDKNRQKEQCHNWYLNNREKTILKSKEWSIRNNDKRRKYQKKYRDNNKKKLYELSKQWKKNNPEKVKIQSKRSYMKMDKIKKREYDLEYREKNKEKLREQRMRRYCENRELLKERSRDWQKRNPYRHYQKYGIDIIALVKRQEKKCAICNKEVPLCVDHCHKRMVIRGMLCRKCNSAIGLFYENIQSLENAIKYLKNASPTS